MQKSFFCCPECRRRIHHPSEHDFMFKETRYLCPCSESFDIYDRRDITIKRREFSEYWNRPNSVSWFHITRSKNLSFDENHSTHVGPEETLKDYYRNVKESVTVYQLHFSGCAGTAEDTNFWDNENRILRDSSPTVGFLYSNRWELVGSPSLLARSDSLRVIDKTYYANCQDFVNQ